MILVDRLKRQLGIGTLPVLCCCDPSNELGVASAKSRLMTKVWIDEQGRRGLAFSSHEGPVPGLMPGKKKGGKKRWDTKKTWEKRKPKGKK